MDINKVLIIVGMHRSGTSLITQWLNKCGLNVGDRVLGPLTGNEEGHFEDLDFVDAHKDILKHRNLPDTGLFFQPIAELSDGEEKKLKELILSKNNENVQWGWKDPRTCLFLEAYKELIPTAYYLFIIRDYAASVSSLINRIYKQAEIKYLNRNWFYAFLWKAGRKKLRKWRLYRRFSESYLKVWILYNEKILNVIQELPKTDYILVDYSLLNKKDVIIFSHLKDQWDFSLEYINFNKIYKGNLMNSDEDISPFVRKKALLNKARDLENKLRSFSFN